MAFKVHVRTIDGVSVVEFHGVGCTELIQLLADDLERTLATERRVVVDLNDSILTDHDHVGELVSALATIAPSVSVVCRRLAARRLLRSTPSSDRVAVYPTVADALRRPWSEHPGPVDPPRTLPGPAA